MFIVDRENKKKKNMKVNNKNNKNLEFLLMEKVVT